MLDLLPATRLDAAQHDSAGSLATPRMSCGRHTGPRWYCAWTNPQREYAALQALVEQHWDCYLPLCLERGNHRPDRIVPLFPRYLFIQFDAYSDQWGAICRTPGISGIIRHGWETPTPLPHGAIDHLISRTSARNIVDDPADTPRQNIPSGAAVSLVGGAFDGLAGVVALSGPNRCRVLLRLFAGMVPVEVPTTSLCLIK